MTNCDHWERTLRMLWGSYKHCYHVFYLYMGYIPQTAIILKKSIIFKDLINNIQRPHIFSNVVTISYALNSFP